MEGSGSNGFDISANEGAKIRGNLTDDVEFIARQVCNDLDE